MANVPSFEKTMIWRALPSLSAVGVEPDARHASMSSRSRNSTNIAATGRRAGARHAALVRGWEGAHRLRRGLRCCCVGAEHNHDAL